jgi:hypothetical protein
LKSVSVAREIWKQKSRCIYILEIPTLINYSTVYFKYLYIMQLMKPRVVGMWHYFEETYLMTQFERRYLLLPMSYLPTLHFTPGCSV